MTAEANATADTFGMQYASGLHFSGDASVPALKELARVYEAGMCFLLALAADVHALDAQHFRVF